MLTRIVMSALLAGLVAGVVSFGGNMWKLTPIITHAEIFENGHVHDSSHAHPDNAASKAEVVEADPWAPENGLERNFWTLITGIVMTTGFAFLLVGGIAISGRNVDMKEGAIWGLCAFAALFAWPSLGLAPEPPGLVAANLADRQLWWLLSGIAAIVALALLLLKDGVLWKVGGVLLLALPYLVGVPTVEVNVGNVPAEIASEFAAASLVLTAVTFLVLGGASGYFYRKFEHHSHV